MNPLLANFTGDQIVLVEPTHAARFEACLTHAAASPDFDRMMSERADTTDAFWSTDEWYAAYRPYMVNQDGILMIPVKGVLLNNFPYAIGNWATGYDYIWRAFQRGCADYAIGAIRGIALIIDSPGGMVAGCFDNVDRAYDLKNEIGVPVRAFAHESAYSAAYAWFTLGDEGVVSRTGGVGSIGVVTSHVDMSGAINAAGYKITFIHAGKHKVDGNPYQPLPDDVKARIQERIDELYQVFVSTVARNRPRLSEEEARATEALTFTATQALSNGLADSIGTLDDALADFAASMSPNEGDDEMSNQDTAANTQAAITADVAEANAAAQRAQAEAVASAITAERARIGAILGCDEAKGRETLAHHLATATDMSVETAKATLAVAPVAAAPAAEVQPTAGAPAGMFEAAMDRTPNPNVSAGGDANTTAATEDPSAFAARAGIPGFRAPAAK